MERHVLSCAVIVTKIFRGRSKLQQFYIFFRGMNGYTGDALPAQIVKTTTYADRWTEKVKENKRLLVPHKRRHKGPSRSTSRNLIFHHTSNLALYYEGLPSVTDSPVRYDCKLAIRKVEIYQFVARGLKTFLFVLRFCQKRRDEQKNYLEIRYGQGIHSLRGYRRCPSGNRKPCERCRVFGYGKEEK
jgi:hypothetical protein